MPLTDLQIRKARPGQPSPGKGAKDAPTKPVPSAHSMNKGDAPPPPYRLWDGGGLYLEVDGSGGKWWRWKYRFAGKEKRLSLGVYPEVSLAKAREERDACRKLLAQGTDPADQRKATKSARKDELANSLKQSPGNG